MSNRISITTPLQWANSVLTISPDMVERVYSGHQGCMCGCQGTYSETPRNITRILNILKNDSRTVIQDGYILHIDDNRIDRGDRHWRGERNYVVYLKRPGKKMEAM